MMQLMRSTALTAIFIGALSLMPTTAFAQDNLTPRILVTGTGSVSIEPDMAIVSMGVTMQEKTSRAALDANTQAMADILAAMKAAGIDESDLQTSNFSIQPQYVYPKSNSSGDQRPRIDGYIVRNSLTVRIRDLTTIGDVLDASVSLGVNDGGNLVFTNDDPKAAISEARAKAMKDAIEKAETLTNAAGVDLGDIFEISEQSHRNRPMPIAEARMMAVAAESAPVPIAAGENTYQVSVNVTFGIEQ
ncbi:MAG: SIMPL domain-containing protein [Pseudomonadota bacterium]